MILSVISKRFLLVFVLGLVGLSTSCRRDTSQEQTKPAHQDVSHFQYQTRQVIPVVLQAGPERAHAAFALYTDDPAAGGRLLLASQLDPTGGWEQQISLPASLERVFFESRHMGLPGGFFLAVAHPGGIRWHAESAGRNVEASLLKAVAGAGKTTNSLHAYRFPTQNQNGVPKYLIQPRNTLSQAFLGAITASLPEGKPVPSYNATYLAQGNQTDLILEDSADVWVTFVHEGAGYRNTLGYYTYPVDQPPQQVRDIDTVHVLFPNVSFQGSGGGLQSGDRIHLGAFGAHTGIGWVLIQDAFRSGSVRTSSQHFYSKPDFNPEPQAADRQHTVLLYDAKRERIVIGFEDIARNSPSCDQDFNDAVFFASANPIEAVDRSRMPQVIESGQDTDGDRVPDQQDIFPNDADRAFEQYVPFEGGYGSYAFEDLWPSRGDYDFNDLVVDYNVRQILNRANELVSLQWTLVIRHIGASYHNGFGIALPLQRSDVSQLRGYQVRDNNIRLDARGLEQGHDQAVIIAFDDAWDHLNDTLQINLQLTQPVNLSNFNQAGLNPFMYANQNRSREIHLADRAPTALADTTLFGYASDETDASQNRWYRDAHGKPWALDISHAYAPPVEKTPIERAYRHFERWVQSRGTLFPDWHEAKNGYRDPALVK